MDVSGCEYEHVDVVSHTRCYKVLATIIARAVLLSSSSKVQITIQIHRFFCFFVWFFLLFSRLEYGQVSGWIFGEDLGRMQSRFAVWAQQSDLVRRQGL